MSVAGLSKGPAWKDLVLRNRAGKKVDRTSGLADIACPFTGEKDRKSEAGESRRARSGSEPLRLGGRLHRFPFHLGGSQFRVGDQKVPDHRLKGFGVGSNCR